jgi:sugar phosphate isomerase/epimerase
MKTFPMLHTPALRLGATSYILSDDILPNVRFLAGMVQDVELLLYQPEDANAPLASGVVAALSELARRQDLTYTVHLPLDLRLGAEGAIGAESLVSARRAIECTRDLNPWAYIVHLDSRGTLADSDLLEAKGEATALERWQDRAAESLLLMAEWADGLERLAVENLEGVPRERIAPILGRVHAGRCVDVGHLWLDGIDPLPALVEALPRLRVVHLHGVAARDHVSLDQTTSVQLDRVTAWLSANFSGVVTLEVFGERDFQTSMRAWAESAQRVVRGSQEG